MSSKDVHLLVLIHGMWGNPSNLASMHRIIKEIRLADSSVDLHGPALHVMLAVTNQAEHTYDGIDWGGERVATEVRHSVLVWDHTLSALLQVFEEIEKIEKEGKRVTRFSVAGYSLGGLLARYLVGCVLSLPFPHHLA
jgi:triacylglycerol esterase/lipase EstA (alpha/beta hydrolase family)